MGILGMDVLARQVLRINIDAREVSILDSPSQGIDWEFEIDIELSNEPRPYIAAKVHDVSIRFLLDTGSAGSVELDRTSFEKVVGSDDRIYLPTTTSTVDRVNNGKYVTPNHTLDFGTFACKGLTLSSLSADRDYSILGGLLLCRFNMEIDFKNQKIYLSRSNLFAARDCSDYCGLLVEHGWLGVFTFGVQNGSIAAKAGIEPGDQIIGVGGLSAERDGERRIMKALQEPRNKPFDLTIRRRGEVKTMEVVIDWGGKGVKSNY
jgi:hypothetical protein